MARQLAAGDPASGCIEASEGGGEPPGRWLGPGDEVWLPSMDASEVACPLAGVTEPR